MTKTDLIQKLEYINHTREKRGKMAELALSTPKMIPQLLEIAFEKNNNISNKAIWVTEYTIKQNVSLLLPYLDFFTNNIQNVKQEQGIRPIAKMCELLLIDYYSKKETASKDSVKKVHLEHITTACFDWLIGEHNVAPKAHAMTCLYLLGNDFDWIHPELKMILEQNYVTGSAAYKARARRVLSKLKR
ncbi:adenylosuccinate lyase [Aurantibacter crassamenti]|uniref:adenylosuccinate lyase n=1 Tax=Aurantibacter crassamenti TaxID=1837375 RepID=UPI001939FD32|nr:adenylosuccinate lyase [Aurantibacter crassamenti]MBM1107569.1 adenylosuccinate lyase [Aurantibacter crassamenti]